jgi:hypothetical protein
MTKQELLDRYVHSVKALLPPDKKDDIAAEINANLQSQIEDRRDLSVEELSGILKQHGHPRVVASRYANRPGQALIGPDLFPFYWSTLRALLIVWAVLSALGAPAVSPPAYFDLIRTTMAGAFLIAAGVTAVFAVWEYLALPFPYAQRWKPEQLPPVMKRRTNQRRPIVGLFFLAMALFWPVMFWVWNRAGIFSPSPTLYAMRLPLFILALLWISRMRVAGLAFALVLLCQGNLLVAGANMNPAQGVALEALNRFFSVVLVVSCISSGLQCVREGIVGRTSVCGRL